MRSNKKRNIMPDAIGYIDDDIVSGVLGKIDKDNKTVCRPRKRGASPWIAAAVAIAACAVLWVLAIPTRTTINSDIGLFGIVGAAGESGNIESLKRNGSRGLLYAINEDGKSAAFVSYGTCTDETVYIASTYEGLPVTVMYNNDYANGRFSPYNQNTSQIIKHLVIPDTVKYVDENCIAMCPNIESVYYGAGVENIQSFNFHAGYGVKFSTVEVSPDNPNYSCKNNCIVDLRTNALVLATHKAVIPDDGSVKIIGEMAFRPACYWLGSIVIPEGVKVIDYGAFSGCSRLESVVFPDSLEIIDEAVFSNCPNLKKVELGSNLKALSQDFLVANHIKEIDYKGTVEQWEAITIINRMMGCIFYEIIDGERKIVYDSHSIPVKSFDVNCTDGVSNSLAGKNGDYEWRILPEYEAYVKQWLANATHYVVGSDGKLTTVDPWNKGGEE